MLKRHGNAFRITGPLWEESAFQIWVAFKKGRYYWALIFVISQYKMLDKQLIVYDLRRHNVHATSL